MSTNFENIFTETTVLSLYTVYINDQELLDEDVLSFEIMFDFRKSFIEGTLIIKDSFGIAELDIFDGKTTVKIKATDVYGEIFTRIFRITNVSNDEYSGRFKSYVLTVVDELFYKLATTYLSKSFSTDPVTALNEYLTELKLDTYLTDNNITKSFEAITEQYNFIVPQDRSIHEFFLYELKNNGYRFWQDRNSINIKNVTFKDLKYIQVENELNILTNVLYSNNTDNGLYGFKIHDFKMNYNNILNSNIEQPVIQHQVFDIAKKSIDTTTKNLSDVYTDMKLNNKDMSSLQHTTGARYDVDVGVYIGKQKLNVENIYFNNNKLEIVVPGNFKYNNVGMLVDVILKGNPTMQVQGIEGDTFHSGKYFVSKMSDRFIGDKLIQKLVLNRIDFQEPRKT
jgi:hypothetical protein